MIFFVFLTNLVGMSDYVPLTRHTLPDPTDEVLEIVDDLRRGLNSRVIAWPGTGKTSMALEIARQFPDRKCLLLVYNSALKDMTREKIKKYGLTNMTCHSFHAAASHYMKAGCCDDEALEEALKATELRHVLDFDILIVDEAQDAKPLFWRFIARIIAFRRAASSVPFNVVHLGDPFQCVYRKMGADIRYLTMVQDIYPADMGEWTQRKLTLSHRLTKQIADTVNRLFLRDPDAMWSKHEGPPVEFYLGDAYEAVDRFAIEIERLIAGGHCTAGDIMVIAPSVKKLMDADAPGRCQPVVRLARRLGKHLVHVDNFEEGGVRDNVSKNKILFTNQCQPKGTERRVVFVLGVDKSLIKFFSGGADETEFHTVTSNVFVAVTRSSERLYVQIDDQTHGYLPFFEEDLLLQGSPSWNVTRVSEVKSSRPREKRAAAALGSPEKPRRYRATDLSRHIEQRAAKEVQGMVTWVRMEYPGWKRIQVEAVRKCERDGVQYEEQVSDLVGLAIPALIEEIIGRRLSTIRDFVQEKKQHPLLAPHARIVNDAVGGASGEDGGVPLTGESATAVVGKGLVTILKSCVIYDALKSGYFHRLRQIRGYGGWLRNSQLKALLQRSKQIWPVAEGFRCEVTRSAVIHHPVHGSIEITGRVDVVCGRIVWETKCTNGPLADDHRLQLLVYAFIFGSEFQYRLINLLTGECIELYYDKERIESAMMKLITEKFDRLPDKTDDAFVAHAKLLWDSASVL